MEREEGKKLEKLDSYKELKQPSEILTPLEGRKRKWKDPQRLEPFKVLHLGDRVLWEPFLGEERVVSVRTSLEITVSLCKDQLEEISRYKWLSDEVKIYLL